MPAASHPIPSPDRNRAPKNIASTTLRTLRVSVPLTAQSTSLRESLGWSNQRDSKASQACYSHPRCNLNLLPLLSFSADVWTFSSSFTHAAITDPFNDWGGRDCNKFVPVLGGNGTKTAPTGDMFDQPPGQMR